MENLDDCPFFKRHLGQFYLKITVFLCCFCVVRYHTLKQILPQLEVFETGFEDELKWLEEALIALEAYKNVNTVEEVESELGRYTVGTLH